MGAAGMELCYVSHRVEEGKYAIEGLPAVYAKEKASTLIVTLQDETGQVSVHLYYGVLEDLDMITRAAVIENTGDTPFHLERALSMNLDFISGKFDFITFYGRHNMERQLSRSPVHHGKQSVGSNRAASSHHYNPFLMLSEHTTTEEQGECYGFSFLYSGDFLGEVECDQMEQTRVAMGIHPDNFDFLLAPGERFSTPEVAMAYSRNGFNTLSQTYHKAYRNHLCRGKYRNTRRPVLLNNWEGTYFDFNGEKLVSMAEEAAKLGAELFVMDDGWFGKRDSDTSGLGDWAVNEEKLGCTLKELSEQIHSLGMQFGIWFEPECISEDSDLYREHPDWALTIPGKKPVRSRFQLVLDFSREDVREFIYQQMCAVLESAQIEYVKWDFNRNISDIYSALLPPQKQGEASHRYVLGLYDMLEKLTSRFPDVLFEGCSGGGGRFDAGMLYYTPQIWCSDNTDAIERLKIQYGTSFGYPISAVGSHVSASPNHQTGRSTPLSTRAIVAMAGTFGYELDVNALSEEEKEEIRMQIQEYKKHYFLIQDGSYHRLTNPFEEERYCVWEYVKEDGSEALVSIVATRVCGNAPADYVKLKGLKEDGHYRINNRKETYLGSALMNGGWKLPKAKEEYEGWNYRFILTNVEDMGRITDNVT